MKQVARTQLLRLLCALLLSGILISYLFHHFFSSFALAPLTTVADPVTYRDELPLTCTLLRRGVRIPLPAGRETVALVDEGEKVAVGERLYLTAPTCPENKAALLRIGQLLAAARPASAGAGEPSQPREGPTATGPGTAEDIQKDGIAAPPAPTAADRATAEIRILTALLYGGADYVTSPTDGYFSARGMHCFAGDPAAFDLGSYVAAHAAGVEYGPAVYTDTVWYAAAVTRFTDATVLREGESYTLSFPATCGDVTVSLLSRSSTATRTLLFFSSASLPVDFPYMGEAHARLVRGTAVGFPLPRSALCGADGANYVYILSGNRALRRGVSVCGQGRNLVYVTGCAVTLTEEGREIPLTPLTAAERVLDTPAPAPDFVYYF